MVYHVDKNMCQNLNSADFTQKRTINQQKQQLDIKKPGKARFLTIYLHISKMIDHSQPSSLKCRQA